MPTLSYEFKFNGKNLIFLMILKNLWNILNLKIKIKFLLWYSLIIRNEKLKRKIINKIKFRNCKKVLTSQINIILKKIYHFIEKSLILKYIFKFNIY